MAVNTDLCITNLIIYAHLPGITYHPVAWSVWCTQYIGVYILYRGVHIIQGCTHYTGMYTLYRGVHIIQGCTHYTWVYILYRGVHIIQGCTHYTGVYTLYRGVHITQRCSDCMQWLLLYLYSVHCTRLSINPTRPHHCAQGTNP